MNSLRISDSLFKRRREHGVALIMVLGMLVLLSALLVAFMTTATTERTSSQAASDGATARQIADSTVNLMIGQIRNATNYVDSDGKANDRLTWASQPGAIRTYSGQISAGKNYPAGGGSYPGYTAGSADYVFKLYSSDRLKVKTDDYHGADLPEEVKVIENWDRSDPDPAYVDLNEPILSPRPDPSGSGQVVEPRYPILDPRARYDKNDKFQTNPKTAVVEGFDAKITTDKTLKLADANGNAAGEVPYLPMPVKWLYVLRDGTIGGADLGTATNPIVGRTAFWTDDETCKLNINTASEGTFWDTPTASTAQESGEVPGNTGDLVLAPLRLNLAAAQPIRGEYQRYPGHPMTTCLSPVLGWLWNLTPGHSIYPVKPPQGTQAEKDYHAFKEAIYQISPFTPVGFPTSQAATWNGDPDALKNSQGKWYRDGPSVKGIKYWGPPTPIVRTKHLYATVDELLFTPPRNDGKADPKGVLNGKLTPQALEKTRFFLTATSRAPEINLFGRPRVTIWPVAVDFDLRTTLDDLFAFTSTIYKDPAGSSSGNFENDKRYHLTRSDAKDDEVDLPLVAKPDAQNSLMYSYLQAMTGGVSGGGPAIPSFGGSFLGKYPLDRDQILTEMFDYMRTVNLTDTGTASRAGNIYVPYTPSFYPKGIVHNYDRAARSVEWSGQVTPLKVLKGLPGETMGLGRFVTISEAALVFHRVNVPGSAPIQVGIQATLCLEMATAMPGLPGLRDTYWTRISQGPSGRRLLIKLNNDATGAKDVQFCTQPLINVVNVSNHDVGSGRAFMPTLGFINSMYYWPDHRGPTRPTDKLFKGDPTLDPNRVETNTASPTPKKSEFLIHPPPDNLAYKRNATVLNYPYVSKPLAISGAASFRFNGPELKVEIFSGEAPDDGRSRLVQTIYLDFPDLANDIALPGGTAAPFSSRLTGPRFDDNANPIAGTDVVRSIEVTGATAGWPGAPFPLRQQGDIRLVAALPTVAKENYQPRGGLALYNNATYPRVHGLSRGHGEPQTNTDAVSKSEGAIAGRLNAVPLMTVKTINGKAPIIPLNINGVLRADQGPGDWDRGLSKHMDGAFGNKVDEGNLKFDYGDSPSGRMPYFRGRGIEETGQSYFSPNRQLPSAVMFGSLPTGVKARQPWQTLLFRPDRGIQHPGGAKNGPPDHLWLDLFHMPVVEPFAISEPFSTMGKVNMNYVIAPFGYAAGDTGGGANVPGMSIPRSYLRRDSALRGVLKSTFIMAVPTSQLEGGHIERQLEGALNDRFRFPIDLDKTIEEFEARLNDQRDGLNKRSMNLFRSASEICDIDLFPIGLGVTNFATFWETTYSQTGDNMRERPYAHIFPRLTTKSNVYSVHMRCQAIRKAPGSDPAVFDPKKDTVVSEYRGSATIERFIDPNDQMLKDYDPVKERVEPFYRYRVVGTKHFAPR